MTLVLHLQCWTGFEAGQIPLACTVVLEQILGQEATSRAGGVWPKSTLALVRQMKGMGFQITVLVQL